MGWSFFWIGEFELNPLTPTPRAFAKAPKSGAITIDHLKRDGARLLFLRVEDRDASTEGELTAAVRGLKRKNAQGQLSCIAWEDGPEDYGVTWPVYGRRRKLSRAEIKERFQAHVETMRAIVDEAAVRLTAVPSRQERSAPPARPRAQRSKPPSIEKLVTALEKGHPGARARALLALAEVDPATSRRVAFEWLARWEGVYDAGRWVHRPRINFPQETNFVNREKQFKAAIDVISMDLDSAAVDSLLALTPYHPSGSHRARAVLAGAMNDEIAQKVCARLTNGLRKSHLSWFLSILSEGAHVGDAEVVKRMLRDPLSFEPVGEVFDSLAVDALKVFWWSRHPEAEALTCELLSREPFCSNSAWLTNTHTDVRVDFPRLLDSPLLPRDKLSASALEELQMACAPEPELSPEQIREILRDARKEAGGVYDDE